MDHVLVQGYDFTEGLGALPHPVLVLAGSRPGGLGADFQRGQLGVFSGAELVVIDGADHGLVRSHRHQVVEAIEAFLQ
jgi:pimeloyl-ACP methyl ester carboxylesterase